MCGIHNVYQNPKVMDMTSKFGFLMCVRLPSRKVYHEVHTTAYSAVKPVLQAADFQLLPFSIHKSRVPLVGELPMPLKSHMHAGH